MGGIDAAEKLRDFTVELKGEVRGPQLNKQPQANNSQSMKPQNKLLQLFHCLD